MDPGLWKDFFLWESGRTVYALCRSGWQVEPTLCLEVVSVGIPVTRWVGARPKPTSCALRLLSPWIRLNRISIDVTMVKELLRYGEIPWSAPGQEGYVLLELGRRVLGCGLLLPGRIRSQIPAGEIPDPELLHHELSGAVTTNS